MAHGKSPRYGSMQFWPRKRAKRIFPKIRSWAESQETKILGFVGYKAGTTHLIIKDNRKSSVTKGEDIVCPVTIIECPPTKPFSIRFFKNTPYGVQVISEIMHEQPDKELSRSIVLPKNKKSTEERIKEIKDYDDIRILCSTQPILTGIGKKKPEIIEMALGGKKEDKLKFAQEKMGKEITIEDVFKEGEQIDIHAVTKGKGFQGPVKRFGVTLRSHKAEKTKRGPATLGGWKAQGHFMYRVAHAGQMGFHTRTEYNKWLIKIGKNPEDIKIKGGIVRFGFVKNPYVLIKGSVAGPKKRLIRMNKAIRPNHLIPSS